MENTVSRQSDAARMTFLDAFKKMSGIAIPMALSYTFSFEVFASGVLAGNYNDDKDHTAAITIISTFMNTFLILGMSPLFAMAVVASNWLGDLRTYKEKPKNEQDDVELATKRARISAVNRSGLIISAVATPPVFLALFFSQAIATNVFRQDENVAGIAQEYLRPYAFAVPGVLARMTFEQMMFTVGKSRDAMYLGLASFTVGTLLSVWLGFGGLGIDAMGLKGIALGYVAEAYFIALMYGLYIYFKNECREFRFFNLFNTDKKVIADVTSQVLTWSGPISFTIGSELLMTFVVGIIAGAISAESQAALSFVMQFIFLIFIFSAAFGIACQQEVGREVGAKCYNDASRLARYSLITTLSYITPICVLIAAWPALLRKMLNNYDDTIVDTANLLTPIMVSGIILDAARYTMLQELRSLADPWGSTALSFFGLAIGLCLSAILGLATDLGIYGVGAGYTIGLGLAAFLLVFRWAKKTDVSYVETVNERMKNLPGVRESLKSLFFGDTFKSHAHAPASAINEAPIDERSPLLDKPLQQPPY